MKAPRPWQLGHCEINCAQPFTGHYYDLEKKAKFIITILKSFARGCIFSLQDVMVLKEIFRWTQRTANLVNLATAEVPQSQ